MTKEERHNLILETLMKHESIPVSNLSMLLDVSAVTIRKDLSELEKNSKLYRSHGRAILIDPYINNRSIIEKENLARHEKAQIGQLASSLITKDDSIIIASGTTVLAMARCIKPIHRLTVISASLKVSELLGANEAIDLIQLGGTLRTSSLSVVGKYAENALQGFSCSKLFIGVDGIDLDAGKLVLSPTRTYAPVIKTLLDRIRPAIDGMIHCSGGAQTKVMNFIGNLHVIKDNLFDVPPLFDLIQRESKTDWKEMYKVFNMGHRMEIYLDPAYADEAIAISRSYGIDARVIGRVEASDSRRLTIVSDKGTFEYQ